MRDGSDLNQHGQAGRQEQASSNSPVTFHEVLLAGAVAQPEVPSAAMPLTIATDTMDLRNKVLFISCFLSLRFCHFRRCREFNHAPGAVNLENSI